MECMEESQMPLEGGVLNCIFGAIGADHILSPMFFSPVVRQLPASSHRAWTIRTFVQLLHGACKENKDMS